MRYGLGEAPSESQIANPPAMTRPDRLTGMFLPTALHVLATVFAVAACVTCFGAELPFAIPLASAAMFLSVFGIQGSRRKEMPRRVGRRFTTSAIVSVTASFGIAPAIIAAWSAWQTVPGWGIVSYPAILIGIAWVCAIAYRMAWNEVIWAAHMHIAYPQRRKLRIASLPMVAVAVPVTGIVCSALGVPQLFGAVLAIFESIWALLISSNSFYVTHPEPFYDESLPPVSVGLILSIAAAIALLATS